MTLSEFVEKHGRDTISPLLFADNLAEQVRNDYRALLAGGIEDEEAERRMIVAYRAVHDRGDLSEANFWFALAYTEWKKGRLSELVKERALHFLENGQGLDAWNEKGGRDLKIRKRVLNDLKEMLNSSMPEKPPRTKKRPAHPCPWRKGDILAYRIIDERLREMNSALYGKLALLRVADVDHRNLCDLAPECGSDDGVSFACYGWVGDEVPPLDVIEGLHCIVLEEHDFGRRTKEVIRANWQILSEMHPALKEPEFQKLVFGLEDVKIVTCVNIGMLEGRALKKRITYVGHDDSPERQNDPFLKTGITDVVIMGPDSFDHTLAMRLQPYLNK